MRWYPFTPKEAILLLLVFVASGIFSYLQPLFVEPAMLPFTYVLVLLLLLMAYFPVAKPGDPLELSRFLAVLFGLIFGAMIVIKEFIIKQNYSWQSGILFVGAVLCPLVAGWLYHLATARRPRS
jgi:hypothetical protein